MVASCVFLVVIHFMTAEGGP